jgi:hypothetical protein
MSFISSKEIPTGSGHFYIALDNKPPAEETGLKYENHSWADIVRL